MHDHVPDVRAAGASRRAGEVRCVYVNVEVAETAREDVAARMRAISACWRKWLAATWPGILERAPPHDALRETLTRWAESAAKPIVPLIDEIHALVGDTLLAVLRQRRAGYPERPSRSRRASSCAGCATCATTATGPAPRTQSSL